MSNCCGIGTCDADRPAATLGPIDGGGGGPLLDDAAWKMGAYDCGEVLGLCLGGPPPDGGGGGG